MPKTKREFLSNFEAVLLPVFEGILRDDVTEFLPYVFQVCHFFWKLETKAFRAHFTWHFSRYWLIRFFGTDQAR